jgi:hypothetical protein
MYYRNYSVFRLRDSLGQQADHLVIFGRFTRNRRRWERHWLNASIRIFTSIGPIDGLGLQVSPGGMYLFAMADLPVGTHIKIEFPAPHSGELIQMDGAIRHRAVYLYGVEFLHRAPAPLHPETALTVG